MKDLLLIMYLVIMIVSENLLAQSSTQSMEFPIYSDHVSESKKVDEPLDIKPDNLDIYNINENNASIVTHKKENRFGVYGTLYGEPEKINLSTLGTDDIGLGIGLKINF